MRRFVSSDAYARARVVTGSLFVLLGSLAVIEAIVRWRAGLGILPLLVFGLALAGLGTIRIRSGVVRGRR